VDDGLRLIHSTNSARRVAEDATLFLSESELVEFVGWIRRVFSRRHPPNPNKVHDATLSLLRFSTTLFFNL